MTPTSPYNHDSDDVIFGLVRRHFNQLPDVSVTGLDGRVIWRGPVHALVFRHPIHVIGRSMMHCDRGDAVESTSYRVIGPTNYRPGLDPRSIADEVCLLARPNASPLARVDRCVTSCETHQAYIRPSRIRPYFIIASIQSIDPKVALYDNNAHDAESYQIIGRQSAV